jgi:Rrf2 family nitric oxide-sensitive transcriptional repressor
MKVANKLASRGYIESTRGSGGGIWLGCAPESIVVGRVIRDMEPDFGLVECFRPENRCVITPACALPRMLDEALKAFLSVLDRYTLADLVTPELAPKMARILEIRLK